MQRNKVLLISFTLMLLILSSIPAFAQQQGKIGPVLECVFAKTDGTYEARFGYNNTTGSVLEIPVGIDNGLLPLELNGIQPTLFETGRKVNVFQVIFSADPGIVLWKLGNSISTAAASGGPRCRPETPTLSAELNGNTQVDLTWNAVSDVTGYKVMVTDASGVETEFKNITATQWSHTDLTCGSTYTYQIKANGVEHDSKPSNAVTVSTPACPPPAPAAPTFSAALVNVTDALLQWTAVEHAASYRVEQEQNGAWVTLATVTDTSYPVTGLACGTSANYRVVSVNVSGEGASAPAAVTTAVCPPLAPTFSAALVNVTDALLQWTAVEHAASYRVEQEQNGAWVTLATVADTSYTVTGLACGTSANYRVVSVNVSGEGTSAPAAVTTAVCPPLAPTFSAALVNVTDALLQWTAVEHAASYRVEQEQNGAWVTLATVTDTSYSVTGLACSTSANYRVVSVNVSGEGASAPAAVTTAACPPPAPAAPTFSAALVNATDALLQWAAVEHAASYRVEQEQNGVWMTLATVTDTSYPVTGLACGTSANYRVVSVNVSGEGASAPAAVTTPVCPPLAPTFSAALVNTTDALLQWSAVEHAASYRVEQEQNGAWVTLATVTDTSYPVTGLACGTSANYRVVSVNVSGEGASAPAAVTTAACVINPVQLLTNPSFEQRLSGWKLSKPSQDGVRCPAKPVASDGQCFYFVRGSAGEKSVLNQVIDVTGMGIDNSTPLTFKMDLQSIGARKGLNLIINAVYEDGTWQQKRYWLPLNTKNYRTITRKFVPAKPVVRLNVVIRYTNANAAGVARFDNLSLSYMPTSAVMPVTQGVSLDGGLLPMPSAPQQ